MTKSDSPKNSMTDQEQRDLKLLGEPVEDYIWRWGREIMSRIDDIPKDSPLRESVPLLAGYATGMTLRVKRLEHIAIAARNLSEARQNLATPPDVLDDMFEELSAALKQR